MYLEWTIAVRAKPSRNLNFKSFKHRVTGDQDQCERNSLAFSLGHNSVPFLQALCEHLDHYFGNGLAARRDLLIDADIEGQPCQHQHSSSSLSISTDQSHRSPNQLILHLSNTINLKTASTFPNFITIQKLTAVSNSISQLLFQAKEHIWYLRKINRQETMAYLQT